MSEATKGKSIPALWNTTDTIRLLYGITEIEINGAFVSPTGWMGTHGSPVVPALWIRGNEVLNAELVDPSDVDITWEGRKNGMPILRTGKLMAVAPDGFALIDAGPRHIWRHTDAIENDGQQGEGSHGDDSSLAVRNTDYIALRPDELFPRAAAKQRRSEAAAAKKAAKLTASPAPKTKASVKKANPVEPVPAVSAPTAPSINRIAKFL